MSEYMGDLSGVLGVSATSRTPTHNTRSTSVDLDMTDFLTLMVAQLQNQSIDESADTSQMLNQLVQMQMITALTNMTEASVMSYASSLVGKEVTVVTYDGSKAKEEIIEVMGTGTYGGEQVIFSKEGNMYYLNEIMAVGRMPNQTTQESGDTTTDKPVDGTDESEETDGTSDNKPVEGTDEVDETDGTSDNKPVEGTDEIDETDGTDGTSDNESVEGTDESGETGETPADRPVESTEEGEEAEPTQDEDSGVEQAEATGGAAEGED